MQIVLILQGHRLLAGIRKTLSSGSKEVDEIKLEVDETWKGFGKTAVFCVGKKCQYAVVDEVTQTAKIPAEVLRNEAVITIGIVGFKDEAVMTSTLVAYQVEKGSVVTIEEPEPNIYAEILSRYADLATRLNNIIANAGDLTNNAELIDARVGADDVVYDTLGEAVRGQISECVRRIKQPLVLSDDCPTLAYVTDIGIYGAPSFTNASFPDIPENFPKKSYVLMVLPAYHADFVLQHIYFESPIDSYYRIIQISNHSTYRDWSHFDINDINNDINDINDNILNILIALAYTNRNAIHYGDPPIIYLENEGYVTDADNILPNSIRLGRDPKFKCRYTLIKVCNGEEYTFDIKFGYNAVGVITFDEKGNKIALYGSKNNLELTSPFVIDENTAFILVTSFANNSDNEKIKWGITLNDIKDDIKDIDYYELLSEAITNDLFCGETKYNMQLTERDRPYGNPNYYDNNVSIYASQLIEITPPIRVNITTKAYGNNVPKCAFFDSKKELLGTFNTAHNSKIISENFLITDPHAKYVAAQGFINVWDNVDTATSEWKILGGPLNMGVDKRIDERINETVSRGMGNVLYKKTWYCCGDSFSEGDFLGSVSEYKFTDGPYEGMNKVYSRFIALRNSMNLQLVAKCGATCGMRNDDTQYSNDDFDPLNDVPSNTNNFFYDQLKKISDDADYITLWFGINDSAKCELGTIDDETVKTFYGALNWSMLQLITKYPLAHIGLIVSNRCNSNYKKAVREVAQKWAVPYLDMEGDTAIPTISGIRDNQLIPVDSRVATLRWNNNFRVSETNGHPNEKAHEYESTFIENWLRSL